jgi:hypothetical protein
MSCGVVEIAFQSKRSEGTKLTSTQLIETMSCVERSSAMIKAKEHS